MLKRTMYVHHVQRTAAPVLQRLHVPVVRLSSIYSRTLVSKSVQMVIFLIPQWFASKLFASIITLRTYANNA